MHTGLLCFLLGGTLTVLATAFLSMAVAMLVPIFVGVTTVTMSVFVMISMTAGFVVAIVAAAGTSASAVATVAAITAVASFTTVPSATSAAVAGAAGRISAVTCSITAVANTVS